MFRRIVVPPDDPLASSPPVTHAVGRLVEALAVRGIEATIVPDGDVEAPTGDTLLIGGAASASAAAILTAVDAPVPDVPEAFALVPGDPARGPALLACGRDERGLAYAVLELADRAEHAGDGPPEALRPDRPVVERPANEVRSLTRLFTSDAYDLPWFRDEDAWRRYLSMLVTQRFNRFSLTLGLGYNFPWRVTDGYLYFAYPFLLDVPGYDVRIPQLPDEERDRNLAALRFASEEAVARGLDFQLGLWTHAYEWVESPDARHTVEGLTPELHAPYCRDALAMLLEACPAIGGITLRTHGESGIPERSWGFWSWVLDGMAGCGRAVGLDLHAKGLDRETLEIALATGLPVTVSPKHSAEHMGLPGHQAAIREAERPPADRENPFVMVSEGSRPFTRYGYGDFLREDRGYDVVFRVWPGTQRLLLWGDPATAAGFGRHAGIAGSRGLEWCEPLSFRGREGTALADRRDGHPEDGWPAGDDWAEHAYTYRLVGRLSYDPDADPEAWRRSLRSVVGPEAAPDAEAALANAGRVLPLVTTAHHPSASNNYYWPEIYTDLPIAPPEGEDSHYYDTPEPKRFGTAVPLDPETFCGVGEWVDEILAGEPSGRYGPPEVAGWLERLGEGVTGHLGWVTTDGPVVPDPYQAHRLAIDAAILGALGRFFAGKLRAAVAYELSLRTGDAAPLPDALASAREARGAWAEAIALAEGAYLADLTFGPEPWLRGAWRDRLAAIDRDVERLAALAATAPPGAVPAEHRPVLDAPAGPVPALVHEPPVSFRPAEPLALTLERETGPGAAIAQAWVRFRSMDQSRTWSQAAMVREGNRFVAAVPAAVTEEPFPLQYLFVTRSEDGAVRRYPGLDADLSNLPYVVVRRGRAAEDGEP